MDHGPCHSKTLSREAIDLAPLPCPTMQTYFRPHHPMIVKRLEHEKFGKHRSLTHNECVGPSGLEIRNNKSDN
jgi:hypothetical protein